VIITDSIAKDTDLILVTGSNGFIGSKVVGTLFRCGFKHLRCFVRASSNLGAVNRIINPFNEAEIEVFEGNLLSRDDCRRATEGVSVIYHLAAGRGEKSYPNAYMNSVVTTRNLLDAVLKSSSLKRFLCVSSFTVYSNTKIKRGGLLDETCGMEDEPHLRGEAYCYAKVRQDELVQEYCKKYSIPYVIVRPGVVYGPGNRGLTGRVGVSTFGVFLHLGGSNRIPLTYVDNCAEAIVLAGLKRGVDGEIFNIVDEDLPTSRSFLRMYKKHAGYFRSIYVPGALSYILCSLWEKYSKWSKGQLPPVFNRRKWSANWKGTRYSNEKIRKLLGWQQTVPFTEACSRYFKYEKEAGEHK
jgi:nucleoside-diphosphate-sugar epimerase